jgi:ribosomal protein L11 methyltransferase
MYSKNLPKSYFEIRLQSPPKIFDPLSNFLLEMGCKGIIFEENKNGLKIVSYLPGRFKIEKAIQRIHQYLKELKSLNFKFSPIKISLRKVKEADWAKNWKKGFKAIRVTRKIIVKPPWEKVSNANKMVIDILPKMAFGTGEHPTTQICIGLLEKFLKPDSKVLDLGTGSGILAVASAKLGAFSVLALDFDQDAIDNAKENVKLNRVGKIIKIKLGTLNQSEKKNSFDLTVANLTKNGVFELFPKIKKVLKKEGIFIFSGIMKKEEAEVLKFLRKEKFILLALQRKKNWEGFAVKKIQAEWKK